MKIYITGTGRFVRDPEAKTASDGSVFARFSIASDGVTKDSPVFLNARAGGKTGESIIKWFKKGYPIQFTGELRQYDDSKNQTKHSYCEVFAWSFLPSGKKEDKTSKSEASDDGDVPF